MASTFVENNEFALKLQQALSLTLAYDERPPTAADLTPSAVMLIFAGTSLLVTRRTESVMKHTGQMAFPGGRSEPGETSLQTALRETEEEVGIASPDLVVVGELPPIDVPTGYVIYPHVAVHKKSVWEVELRLSPGEIAETLWVPWSLLSSPDTYRKEWVTRGAFRFSTHVFYVEGHRIWGATAAMIKNLLDRCNRAG
jgi:8-oxo-dGTP pyrophosphatase MutT (NUDIX family)